MLTSDVEAELQATCARALRSIVTASPSTSERLNAAAACATSQYLLLLHDDVGVPTDGFLSTLLALAQDSSVGMVGCRLLATDGTLAHAGHVYTGRPGSAYTGYGTDMTGWGGLLQVDREVSGVSTACALIRADVFDRVGGFSASFWGSDRDVDLSLKVRSLGLRILYTPHATLYHFGDTDGPDDPGDRSRLEARWSDQLNHDPYHHPKLLRGRDDWAIPFGPDA
jgi:GT2 family glycosyltransferase